MVQDKNNDNLIMNDITIKLSTEQIALINKILMPYVELYATINNAYKLQQEYSKPTEKEIIEEAKNRG